MVVSPVSSTQLSNTVSSTHTNSATSLDYNSFLKLLVAEMKNQNPTEPMDATKYMAQLASFSAVEQAIQTNARLDKVISTISATQAPDLIGKTITTQDGETTGKVESIQFFSDKVIAVLEDGAQVAVGPGITVSLP